MKKIFEAEYSDDLARNVAKWIEAHDVFRPTVVVEIFDQNGNPLVPHPLK